MTRFSFGGWTANPSAMTLTTVGRVVKVEPKAMAVLRCLAEHSPDVVSKETLFEKVWAGVVVGENALHRVVRLLRQALGDDARQPTYIEVVPRAGYRLLVSVNFDAEARGQVDAASRRESGLGELCTTVRLRYPTVTVGPDYNGLRTDVVRYLAWTSPALKMVGPTHGGTSETHYAVELEIEPQADGATAVLWDLWHAPSNMLVSASRHLEQNLLANRRRVGDLIAEGIARDIRHHRRSELDARNDIDGLHYWDLILLSDHYRGMDVEHISTRRRMLQSAIADHPRLAPAHAMYADFVSWLIANGLAQDNKVAKGQVLDEVVAALDLDATHPYVLRHCGSAYSRIGEHERGVELCRTAAELAPSVFCKDLYAQTLSYAGRPGEAIATYEEILRTMPTGHVFHCGRMVIPLVQAGRFDEAKVYAQREVTHFPTNYYGWAVLANVLAQTGDIDGAKRAFAQMQALVPTLTLKALIEGTGRTYGRVAEQRENLVGGLRVLENLSAES